MLRQQHQVFVTLLAIIDSLVVAAACGGAWLIRELVMRSSATGYRDWWPASWESYVKEPLFVFAVPIALMVMQWSGLYRPRRDRTLVSEQAAILRASLVIVALLVLTLWVAGNALINDGRGDPAGVATPVVMAYGVALDAGRVQLAALAVCLPVCLGLHRFGFRAMLRVLRRRGWNLRHVAVIGCGRLGQVVTRTLERNSWTGIRVRFFVSHLEQTSMRRCMGKPVQGGLADLEESLDDNELDAVYVALPQHQANQLPELLARLERFSVDVRVVPDVAPRHLPQSMAVSELDGMPILSYRENPTHGFGGLSKRVMDIVGASAALLVFAPIMLLTAIAVRLSGPGPIVFRQQRVSLGGQVFRIYKFRTMRHATDEAGLGPDSAPNPKAASWTKRDDPRITPLGRFLRRTSLDELPQLFNVLRGDMSLVGPRPERPELIDRFRDDWRGYMLRQHVKAGITGWAQVNGLRGDTSLRKRLQYDLFYVRHWSLWLDVRILLMTLRKGFIHPNAH